MGYKRRYKKSEYRTVPKPRQTSIIHKDIIRVRASILEREDWETKNNRYKELIQPVFDRYHEEKTGISSNRNNLQSGFLGFKTDRLRADAEKRIALIKSTYTAKKSQIIKSIWQLPFGSDTSEPPSKPTLPEFKAISYENILNNLKLELEKSKAIEVERERVSLELDDAKRQKREEAKQKKSEELEAKRISKLEETKRLRLTQAKLAAFTGQSRKKAASLKVKLSTDHYCPYCAGVLGKKPHADHIYPVSKGGLSVETNMVYVCSNCNLKKRDMTLTAFIKKHGLDRDLVEESLMSLGKDI